MSKIIEILTNEHNNIASFVEDLREKCLKFMVEDTIDIEEMKKAVDFIKEYADDRHHKKEEQILFKAMTDHLGTRAENLIKHGMLVEHDMARLQTQELEKAVNAYEKDKSHENKLDLISYAMGYCYLLKRHIDKENGAVYPFGEKNLPDNIMNELDKAAVIYEKAYE